MRVNPEVLERRRNVVAANSARELERVEGGKFWVSPDIITTEEIRIPNSGLPVNIPVVLPPDFFPGPEYLKLGHAKAKPHTSSKYQQLWFELQESSSLSLAQSSYRGENGESDKLLGYVQGINFGARPVVLGQGSSVGNLFTENQSGLSGKALQRSFRFGDIEISGRQGKDWDFIRGKDGQIKGVEFVINPEKWGFIPPHPENEEIRISGKKGANYRAQIDDLLQPLPLDGSRRHVVGETKSLLFLSENVHGIIVPIQKGYEGQHLHGNSHFIRGGNTPLWPIRGEWEVISKQGLLPYTMEMRFVAA